MRLIFKPNKHIAKGDLVYNNVAYVECNNVDYVIFIKLPARSTLDRAYIPIKKYILTYAGW